MLVYKIRNKQGLYSTGGTDPSFTKKGKVWAARGHVTSHLTQLSSYSYKNGVYKDCEIVQYEVVEEEVCVVPVSDWKELPSTTRAKQLEASRMLAWKAEQLKKQQERIQKELNKVNSAIKGMGNDA